MRKVLLAPGVESSVLGFGCAPILGSVGARSAASAMACALDVGINHFDVARVYGYGQAERFIGSFLRGRRHEVVIASKCGLEATPLALALRPLKPLLRLWRGTSSSPRSAGAPGLRASRLMRRVPITAMQMEQSLMRSLKALGTSYLDIFFLHEPDWGALDWAAISDCVLKLKQQGKIRASGAAFYRADGLPPDFSRGIFDVLQFDCPANGPDYDRVKEERGGQANVLFSPSRVGTPGLQMPELLGQLWRDFPRSIVLSSMFNPSHIRSNAAKAA